MGVVAWPAAPASYNSKPLNLTGAGWCSIIVDASIEPACRRIYPAKAG
jgi:hypothetical protein